MAYIDIEDFKYGLDRRKARFAGVPGSLWDLENAHITRGGEIERCKKFVTKFILPTGQTLGFFCVKDVLYTFGSVDPDSVTMPDGVVYQQLVHPLGSAYTMTDVLDVQPFDGKPYVVAKFSDGTQWHFYGGDIVSDQGFGIVLPTMTSYADIASQLAFAINQEGKYTAAVNNGDTVVVTGKDGSAFTYSTFADGINQTVTSTLIQSPVAASAETLATGGVTFSSASTGVAATAQFTVTGLAGHIGSSSYYSSSLSGLTHNGQDLLAGTINTSTGNATITLPQQAQKIVDRVNSRSGTTGGYTATRSGNTVIVSAPLNSGATPNGTSMSISGQYTAATAFSGGVFHGITGIVVNGVQILGSQVNNPGSMIAFAAAVAAQIAAYTSSPEYTASAASAVLTVKASPGSGTTPNGYTGTISTSGTVTLSSNSFTMSGGISSGTVIPQIVTFKLGNSFLVGAHFGIELTKGVDVAPYGAIGSPETPGDVLLLYKTKMYAGKGSLVDFSSVGNATIWNRDAVGLGIAGQGFINVANQDEGTQDVTALGRYNQQVAIFSETSIQIWNMSADPAENSYDSTLDNTGTKAKKSVIQYGNTDLFYLDPTGIRSVRARATTNAAFTNDIGTAIDTFVQQVVLAAGDALTRKAQAVIEPSDGRYWLAVGDTILVFSYFPSSKISAWSYYKPGFVVNTIVRNRDKLYVRSGDTVYLYGGDDGQEYPLDNELPVTFETPFLTAGKIATRKQIMGFDTGIENEWDCHALIDMNRPDVSIRIGVISKSTYNQPYVDVKAKASHIALRMTCSRAGYAKISNLALHFKGESEKAG